MSKEIDLVTKTLPTKRSPGPNSFTCKLYQTLKEEWMSVLLKLLKILKRKEHVQTYITRSALITWVRKWSIQFSSVAQSCPTLCDPMNHSMPGLPVHHQRPEFTQTHVHWVGDAIQPSHPLLSPFPPAPNPSQHQGLFQWVNSSHEVAKVLEFQLQHQSFQWTPRTNLL